MADPTTPESKTLLIAEYPLIQTKAVITPLMVVDQGKRHLNTYCSGPLHHEHALQKLDTSFWFNA
jgi:hypothetical protein